MSKNNRHCHNTKKKRRDAKKKEIKKQENKNEYKIHMHFENLHEMNQVSKSLNDESRIATRNQ